MNEEKELNIAIVDDEKIALDLVSVSVSKIIQSQGVSCQISTFGSQHDFLQAYAAQDFDLLLLDISMPEGDGILFANKVLSLRSDNPPTLIFVSSHQDRVFDSLTVHPFGFIRKDNFLTDIPNVITRYLASQSQREQKKVLLRFEEGHTQRMIDASSLLYIESRRNDQYLHLANEKEAILIHSTLDKLALQVEECSFLRIHKSYLVNEAYIKSFGRNEVLLSNGDKLPVGRSHYAHAMDVYLGYVREHKILKIG